MVDHEFITEKELEFPHSLIPSFLSIRSQLLKDEVTENQNTTSLRIHVERAIKRIKKFKVLNYISFTPHGFTNQIWTVTCILYSFFTTIFFSKLSWKISEKVFGNFYILISSSPFTFPKSLFAVNCLYPKLSH